MQVSLWFGGSLVIWPRPCSTSPQTASTRSGSVPSTRALVPDLLSPKEKGLFHGLEKSYKTWVVIDLAKAVATEGSFLNYEARSVAEPRPVLLVEEGHEVKFAQRLVDLLSRHRCRV